MATYVFSDVHGHAKTLRRALDKVSPSEEDRVIMLGDMIDRGPDPMDVIAACRELPNCEVLKGNHEDLMLTYLQGEHDPIEHYLDLYNWKINGGETTRKGLKALRRASRDDYDELIDWFENLPLWTHAWVGDQLYLFVHAGIDPRRVGTLPEVWDDEAIDALMRRQEAEDLVWIREDFWTKHTGLVNEEGKGPIVVAGHTPTPYLALFAGIGEEELRDEDGLYRMGRLGADESTGGVADRWDVDCGCAGGHGFGQLLILRLDDGEEHYERVLEDE